MDFIKATDALKSRYFNMKLAHHGIDNTLESLGGMIVDTSHKHHTKHILPDAQVYLTCSDSIFCLIYIQTHRYFAVWRIVRQHRFHYYKIGKFEKV